MQALHTIEQQHPARSRRARLALVDATLKEGSLRCLLIYWQ